MNYFKQYLDYLKDNPEGLWFKRKLYGWGWTPATWQGWLAVAIVILVLIWNGMAFASHATPSTRELLWFFARIIVPVALLIFTCYKTGEKPKWQWGEKK